MHEEDGSPTSFELNTRPLNSILPTHPTILDCFVLCCFCCYYSFVCKLNRVFRLTQLTEKQRKRKEKKRKEQQSIKMEAPLHDPASIPTNVRYYLKFLHFRHQLRANAQAAQGQSQSQSQRVVVPAKIPVTQAPKQKATGPVTASTPAVVPASASTPQAESKERSQGSTTIEQLQCILAAAAAGVEWVKHASSSSSPYGVYWAVETDSKAPFSISQSVELRQPLAICKYFSECK